MRPKNKEMLKMSDTTIANEILRQLGGNKFTVMTGSKNYLADKNSLRMKLTKNISRATHLKITLNGKDLYDLEFTRVIPDRLNHKTYTWTPGSTEEVKVFNDIYCDQLQNIFTSITGMYTHL
jgi:uncharacterized protein YfaS (alpha-2-macroglobulin family)